VRFRSIHGYFASEPDIPYEDEEKARNNQQIHELRLDNPMYLGDRQKNYEAELESLRVSLLIQITDGSGNVRQVIDQDVQRKIDKLNDAYEQENRQIEKDRAKRKGGARYGRRST